MATNLEVGGVGRPSRLDFPYSNWGPWAAVLGVLLALGVGIVLGVPALLLGKQEGGLEGFSPPSYSSATKIDATESSGVAVDSSGPTIYSDQIDQVVALTLTGKPLGPPFGSFDESRGIAVDSHSGRIYVADGADDAIQVYRWVEGRPRFDFSFDGSDLPGGQASRFEPGQIAITRPDRQGPAGVYVVDRGNDTVDRFSIAGRYVDQLAPPRDGFSFGDSEGIAVDDTSGRNAGDVYVVAGSGDESGATWAFDRAGALLWEIPGSEHEACGVAVDGGGHLWIAGEDEGTSEYASAARANAPPAPTGRSAAGDKSACTAAFTPSGRLMVATEGGGLTTAGNIGVQIATALGFLLVPFAIAAGRGATVREAAAQLGLRRFRPGAIKWMLAAIGAYLAFAIAYTAIFGQPHQKDIAEDFGTVPVQVLLIVIAAPVSEEVCFRGMLFGGLRERWPRIVAALISGLIFGGLHAFTGISAVPPLIFFGFILALLYEKTGSIWPGIMLHMLNNSVALLGQ